MKVIICTLCILFFSNNLSSQEMFSVDVFVDPKMAMKKDSHGNNPFTLDLLVNYSVQFEQRAFGYYSIGQSIEYADLYGGEYLRYSLLQVSYTFNRFSFTDRLEATIALNFGMIKRWAKGYNNYGGNFDIAFAFTDRIKLTSLLQIVKRTDIENPMKKHAIFRASVFLGFKLNLSKITMI